MLGLILGIPGGFGIGIGLSYAIRMEGSGRVKAVTAGLIIPIILAIWNAVGSAIGWSKELSGFFAFLSLAAVAAGIFQGLGM